MPRASTASGSERIRFAAPRILKAPPRCRFSHLKKTRLPAAASKLSEVMTGVRRARGRMRSAAARTSSGCMARYILLSLHLWGSQSWLQPPFRRLLRASPLPPDHAANYRGYRRRTFEERRKAGIAPGIERAVGDRAAHRK